MTIENKTQGAGPPCVDILPIPCHQNRRRQHHPGHENFPVAIPIVAIPIAILILTLLRVS